MPTITGSEWLVAGIRVDAIRANIPERTRGRGFVLETVIRAGEEAAGDGLVMDGPDGALMDGASGGIMALDADSSPIRRYKRLRAYTEYAGEGSSYQLIGGLPAVHENPQDEWPVDSHIIAVETPTATNRTEGFWALIVGVDDESDAAGVGPYELDLEMTFLADLDRFESRSELLDELSPVTVQLPDN